MFRKTVSFILSAMLVVSGVAATAASATANPSTNSVYVDGVKANVAAYKINGNNYFKLRDIAAIVNGSEKQFEVEWDGATQRIDLTSGEPYTSVGGELSTIASGTKSANPSNDVIYKDNVKMDYTGYKIGGNNFYKLRDVCQSFDIGVEYDNATQRVDILTDESYVEEGTENPTTEDPDDVTEPDDVAETDESEYSDAESDAYAYLEDPKYAVPEVGEYNEYYLQQLEESGEEIVTVTVKYKIVEGQSMELVTKAAPMYVYQRVYTPYSIFKLPAPCMTFMSSSTGSGEFTFKMTKSNYDIIRNGEAEPFFVSFVDPLYYNGKNYGLAGGTIDQYALQGYRIQYLAM